MFGLWEGTLIAADNVEAILAIIASIAALSIILEQKYKWASKITGAIIALILALILSNLKIIPVGSSAEGVIWEYIVPLAIPMLLFSTNIIRILKESGRMLIIYLISAFGTLVGGVVAVLVLGNYLSTLEIAKGNIDGLAAMMSGTYTGGSLNFAAMAQTYDLANAPLTSAAVVADNLLMVFYLFLLLSLVSMPVIRRVFKHPYIDEVEKNGVNEEAGKTLAASYWGRKEISLKDIALTISVSLVIVAVSTMLSDFIASSVDDSTILGSFIVGFIGNKYLILTTITIILATVFAKQFENIRCSQELGIFLIYMFFVAIGIPASISEIVKNAPILLVFALIMGLLNIGITLLGAKIFKFSIEESILASNANMGGPTTAAAIAISKGWTALIAPILLIGTFGYVIGNYIGLFVGYITSLLGY